MKTNEAGVALIKKWESFRAKPYICPAGVATIGYGTTVYPNGRKVTMQDKPITEAVADQYLREHLVKLELQVAAALKVVLNDNRFSALVSFAYNVGMGRNKTARYPAIPGLITSTLLKTVNAAPGAPGVRVEFMKWTKATVNGKKVDLPGLVSRRKSEADLYFNI
jgi:lysozyme